MSTSSISFQPSSQEVAKPTTILEFLGFSVSQQRPNVSDAELEHSHATLSGNALIRSERDYFFGADMITQARKRTTSMLSKASSFGPFSPCLSPLSLSPLGHPLFQDAAPAPRSPSEGSDSTWSSGSDSDLIDESFSDSNTNPSRDTLTSPSSEAPNNRDVVEGLNPLFADIPLVQEVQTYSDTDSFTEYRATRRKSQRDIDNRSICSNSTDGSCVRGPLLMTPLSSMPGTPVVESTSTALAPSPSDPGLTLKFIKPGKKSMTKFGQSFMKALELHGKKSRA